MKLPRAVIKFLRRAGERIPERTLRTLQCLLLWNLLIFQATQAQFIYKESFTGTTAAGWEFSQGNTSPGPRLTAAAEPTSADPEFGAPAIDNDGNGWLRLATTTGNQSNAVAFDTSFAAQNSEIKIGFDYAFWKPGGSPADGVTAFLWDAAEPFSPGAFGGSLGYANRTGVDGLGGGYVGAGLDVWGNFSNPTEGRNGGTGFKPGQVAVRGPGSGQTGFEFLGGTDSNGVASLDDTFGTGFRMDFPNSPTRPDQDAEDFRRFEMILDANDNLTVRMQSGFTGDMTDLFTVALPGDRPDQLRFGFAGSTGGSTEVFEIRNLEINVEGGTNAFYWDNENGDPFWDTNLNWNPDTAPTDHSFVYFTDRFPGTQAPQVVNVNVSPVLNSMTFNGATAYNLGGTGIITFDTNGTGAGHLSLLNSPNGNADQVVGNNLLLANDLNVQNLTDKTLTLNGDINTTGTGHALNFTTSIDGAIRSSGDISGTGDITLDGFGVTVFDTANTYTGSTTIGSGTLQIENAESLGSPTAGAIVNNGGTLALAGGITVVNESLSLAGEGVDSQGALFNQSGNNTWNDNITLMDDSAIGANNGTQLTVSGDIESSGSSITFLPKAGATIAVNGTLSGAGTDVVYAGQGTTEIGFFSDHTYTGTTTIRSGTVLSKSSVGAFGENAFGNNAGPIELGDSGTAATDDISLFFNTTGPANQNWQQIIANRELNINDFGNEVTFGVLGGFWTEMRQAINLNRDLTLFADTNSELRINNFTASGQLNGSGNLTKTGEGTVLIRGNQNYFGNLTINEGIITIANATDALDSNGRVIMSDNATALLNITSNETIGSLAGGGPTGGNVNISPGITLTVGNDNTASTFSGVLGGNGNLTKTGTGEMVLTGNNTLSGTLAINNGTVTLGADNTVANSMDLLLNGGELAVDGFANAMDQLTLQSDSTMDFLGKTGGFLTFDAMTRNGGALTIENWIGNFAGNGDTRLQVLDNTLGGDLLNNITFVGWGDAELIDLGGGLFEIVPDTSGFTEWDPVSNPQQNRWDFNNNWSAGAPDAAGAQALIRNLDANLNGRTITLNGADRTVGTLAIGNTTGAAFTIADNTLVFNNNGNPASLTLIGNSSPTIASGISLSDDLIISQNSTGALTLAGTTLATNGNNLNVTGEGTSIIGNQVTGGGTLTKNGPGLLRLNGNNTHSGNTILNGGTLQIGNDSALGTGQFTINGGVIEAFGADRTVGNELALNEDFTISGNNNLTFQGGSNQNLSWTGERVITVDSVTATFGTTRRLQGGGSLTLEGGGTLNLQGGRTTFSGGLHVNDGLVTVGTPGSRVNSALRFGGGNNANAFLGNGDISVNPGGTLEIWKSGNGNIDFRNGVTLNNTGGNILIDSTGGSADFHIGDPGGDSPADFVQSAGTTTFNMGDDAIVGRNSTIEVSGGAMTFNQGDDFRTQGTSGNAATVEASDNGQIAINLNNGSGSVFDLDQDDTIRVTGSNASIDITTSGAGNGSANLNGDVVLSDSGVLSFTNNNVTLNATATLNGGSTGDSGTLLVRDGDITVDTNADIVNAPNITLEINGAGSQTLDGAAGNSNVENLGVVEKNGTGELLLGSNLNNIQAEKLLISEGTLILGSDDQIANSTGMELAGGTWDTDGFSEVLGTLTLSAESNIDLGNGSSIIQFSESSNLAWDGSSTIFIDNWDGNRLTGGGTDQLIISNAGLTESQLGQVVFRNPTGLEPGLYDAVFIGEELVPVPEPATVIGGTLLALFALWRERKRLPGLLKKGRGQSL